MQYVAIGTAVKSGMVNNETLGYFIARTYVRVFVHGPIVNSLLRLLLIGMLLTPQKFLCSIGIKKTHIRFRQHLTTEMAHYGEILRTHIPCSLFRSISIFLVPIRTTLFLPYL